MISPSSGASAFNTPLSLEKERKARIDSFLKGFRQPTPSAHISTIDTIDRIILGQNASAQTELAHIAHRDACDIALLKGRLIVSANRERKVLADVEKELEEALSQRRRSLNAVKENIHDVRQKIKKMDVLQERLDALEKRTFQNDAHFKQQIHQELLFQQDLQQKIHVLEGQIVKAKQELDRLQGGIVSLKDDSKRSHASLLEVQQQEALLKKGLVEAERKIKQCQSRNARYRKILIAASVAAVVACIILIPPVGVAAGECSVGIVLGHETSLTFTTAAGAVIVASTQDKKKTQRVDANYKQERYWVDREDFLEMAAAGAGVASLFKGVDAVVASSIDWVCSSSPNATQQCRNVGAFYRDTKDLVIKTALQSIQSIENFAAEQMQVYCLSFPDRNRQCKEVKAAYDGLKAGLNREIVYPIKQWLENRPQQIEEAVSYYEKQLGIPPHMTREFYDNGEQVAAGIGMALLGKAVLPSKKMEIYVPPPTHPPRPILPVHYLSIVQVPVSEDHYLNRRIKKRSRMKFEDVGIGSLEPLKNANSGPYPGPYYHLDGWMTRKKDVFSIRIENIDVPEGRLNMFTVMSNFKKMAKANQASVLQIEARFPNEQLLELLIRRYGKPTSTIKKKYGELREYHVFKIPVE